MTTFADEYRQMAKPRAIEGVGDTFLLRPLGGLLARVLAMVPWITPSIVSVLALLAGWLTAWFYYRASAAGAFSAASVYGALALLLHSVLDSADGQLARLTERQSQIGYLVDGACDIAAFVAIYAAILLGYISRGDYPFVVFLLAAGSGYAHSHQSAMVDYVRLLYQDYASDRHRMEDKALAAVEADMRRITGVLGDFFVAWYRSWCRQQRNVIPSTGHLQTHIEDLRESHPASLARLPAIWRRHQAPLMRGWWLVASNSRKTALVVCSAVPVFGEGFWGGLGMAWYYVFGLALIVPATVMTRLQRRADAAVMAELKTTGAPSSPRSS